VDQSIANWAYRKLAIVDYEHHRSSSPDSGGVISQGRRLFTGSRNGSRATAAASIKYDRGAGAKLLVALCKYVTARVVIEVLVMKIA
jgi:hypothetical protein